MIISINIIHYTLENITLKIKRAEEEKVLHKSVPYGIVINGQNVK